MRFATYLIPILMLSTAGGLAAQEEPSTAESPLPSPVETPQVVSSAQPANQELGSRFEVRERLVRLLRQHSWDVVRVLSLDPNLLANEAYLASYPALARFAAEHPEVRSDPFFYLGGLENRQSSRNSLGNFLEALMIFVVFLLIALALAWLVRTFIDQKRWNRVSQTQSEVHNKILDRFTATDELMEYIGTPAGSRFLESAPIPIHEARPAEDPPLARVMWSTQIGVVVAATAIGMLLVSFRFDSETAEGLFGLGVVLFSLGAGFVGSAAVSIFLSRRLSLVESVKASAAGSPDLLADSRPVK